MKHDARQRVARQERHQLSLTLFQTRWAGRIRKWQGQVQVQPRINSMLACQLRGPLRIGHENHRTDGGNAAMEQAVQHPVSRAAIPPPIVRINDQHPSSTVVPDARFRYSPRVGNYQSPWLTRSAARIVIHCADVLHWKISILT